MVQKAKKSTRGGIYISLRCQSSLSVVFFMPLTRATAKLQGRDTRPGSESSNTRQLRGGGGMGGGAKFVKKSLHNRFQSALLLVIRSEAIVLTRIKKSLHVSAFLFFFSFCDKNWLL